MTIPPEVAAHEPGSDAAVVIDEARDNLFDRSRAWGRELPDRARGLVAFLLYLVATIVIWAGPIITQLRIRYVGDGRGDAKFFQWSIGWVHWALAHHVDPLYMTKIFTPDGTSLAWTTFVPGGGVLMYPVRSLFGSLAAVNVLLLLASALACWAAYLVCYRLTHSFWPSLAGGYLFGYCQYMAGQMHGHVNLVLIFPVPLAVYLVIRRIEGSLGRPTFIALMTLSLTGLFLFSTEVFATSAFFGAIAFLIVLIASGSDRGRVFEAGLLTAASYVLTFALLTPYLVSAAKYLPEGSILAHNIEDAGYLSIALVLVLVGFAITERHRRGTWGLLAFVAVVSIAALGPVLHVMGRASVSLPWSWLIQVPLIRDATPDRFPAYSGLAVGVIAAIWLARAPARRAVYRWGLVGLGVSLLFPDPGSIAHLPQTVPAFFSSGTYRSVLQPDEVVFAIPDDKAEELIWQNATDFSFRLAAGYVGILPDRYAHEWLNKGLSSRFRGSVSPITLAAWLTERQVSAIVVTDAGEGRFAPVIRSVGGALVYQGGGVSVWRSPSRVWAAQGRAR
ncbi:MAG: hypothetical protein E6G43_11825 [Actinobacteria bacterium]|nr:MAG: hypothetical protein E6G43_11825 [Actinomycetota bacterium]